ncbi:MAG: DUF4252 domain-containing protein [Bacteroidetes bacterium]|nr:DUF4252 domain-containing protein [Bacteroidota bacterium]
MKAILASIAVIIISTAAYSQNSKVDEVFSKFQDKEGITSVLLTSDLIRFASEIDSKDSGMEFLKKITQVRILSFENAMAQDVVLFEKWLVTYL